MKTNKKVHLWMKSPEAIIFLNCLFSKLSVENPNGVPQTHTDYTSKSIATTFEALQVNTLIAFTPMHEDGCMLLIWTQE